MKRPRLEPAYCDECGTRVSRAGRAPKDGRRWCKQPQCQAARARVRRAATPKLETRQAPTSCSNCRVELPNRLWRAGDETGRWCKKPRCRANRDEVRKSLGAEVAAEFADYRAMHEATMRLLNDAELEERVHCPKCGLIDAVPGWGHYGDHEGTPCRGTIDERSARFDPLALGLIWNGKRTYVLEDGAE